MINVTLEEAVKLMEKRKTVYLVCEGEQEDRFSVSKADMWEYLASKEGYTGTVLGDTYPTAEQAIKESEKALQGEGYNFRGLMA